MITSMHVVVQLVTSTGNVTTTFMGFSEPEERGISGYLSSVHASCEPVIPWENLMNEISSVIPDGESLNTGERNGL